MMSTQPGPESDLSYRAIRETARNFLSRELAPRIEGLEQSGEFGADVFRGFCELGLGAPMLQEPYGSGDLMAQCIVAEEMGYVSCGFGLSALASVSLFGANVARQGTAEQISKYLPGIANGSKIGCWGLTEPGVGSDALSVNTRCVRKGDHYLLSGSKTFITNAPIADYFIVIAREAQADGKLRSGFEAGTAFILERGMEGLRTGKALKKLGHWSSPTGEVFMENMRVPLSQVLNEPGAAFAGMKVSLDVERAIFSGLGIGLMEFCLRSAVRYAATRKQFGVPIAEHQLIQDKIARIASNLDVARSYQYQVIAKLMRGESVNKEAAILKYLGATFAFEAASEAVQILGGYGYMREYQVERCLRDAKLFEIGGGTSEIQKMIIAKQTIKEILGDGNRP